MKKKKMKQLCKHHNITIPKNSNGKQLDALLYSFYEDAAVVSSDNGYELLRTNKVSTIYKVDFTIIGHQFVRAESKDAAQAWVSEFVRHNSYPELDEYEYYDFTDIITGDASICICETSNYRAHNNGLIKTRE